MARIRQNATSSVVCVVGCALLILAQRTLPEGIGGPATTLLFFATILLAGVLGGWKAGITAIVLGLSSALFLFSPPLFLRVVSNPVDLLRLMPFIFLGVGLTVICELLQRAWRRIEDRQHRLEEEVAERKLMEDNLRRLAADLSEADRRKDEFLATLAHELRNPLAPIRSGLELLRLSANDRATFEQARTMMERQLGQLVRLVDDLMDVSRINHGKLELRSESLNVATAISNALETSRSVIDEMNHEITIEMPPEPVFVMADPIRLSQVFMNLLTNAAKYSDRGSRIWVTVERHQSEAVISIRDEGIGLAPDQLPRIFDLFSQIDHTIEKSQGGLGIGLSLVKRLTQMQGGQIEAKSEGLGKGSVFIVRLPILNNLRASTVTECDDVPDHKSKLRILVVDDNRDSADSLSMLLKMMGNQTRTAYDGAEAISVTEEFQPDVILLDIGLPLINGYEVCRRIRQQPGGGQIVIIAQTGWGAKEDRDRTCEAGFNLHLVKPIDPHDMMKLLVSLPARSGG